MAIHSVDFTASDAQGQFVSSLVETGFGILKNHPLEQSFINQIYHDWAEFFLSDDKHQYDFDPKNLDGYVSPQLSETAKGHHVKDLKEFYQYYEQGRCPDALAEITRKMHATMCSVAQTLLNWIEAEAPSNVSKQFSMPLSQMIDHSPRNQLRIIYYPPLTGDEAPGAVRAAAHEDIDLLTILPAATAKGLEVMDKAGDWYALECDPSCLIINSGDMLQECSGGYFQSTTHRVVNPDGGRRGEARMSMPLFFHPRDDVVLSDQHTAGSYLQERLRELGLQEEPKEY